MKVLEFESVSGMPIGVMPQKLAAFSGSSTPKWTLIYLTGDSVEFTVKGSYEEIKEKIRNVSL